MRKYSHPMIIGSLIAILCLSLAGSQVRAAPLSAGPVGTAFTYQGQLKDGSGNPITNTCDFQFSLYDALTSGSLIGSTQEVDSVTVTNGYFTSSLDFGAAAFGGDARWLEIAVRCPAGGGGYTTLSPRQPLTPTPYSLYAVNAGLLDGLSAASFALASHTHWGQTWTGSGTGLTLSGGTIGLSGDGSTYGVSGSSASTSGYGVFGHANATVGTTYGVYGQSDSTTSGVGVYGKGQTGVYGSGITDGVYANALSGNGVSGISGSGVGVWGNSSTGNGVGGRTANSSSYGVYGTNASSNPNGVGVYGSSPNGYGISGSGLTGVSGTSTSTSGTGLFGNATAISGTNYGVFGQSNSTAGFGVFGYAAATSGWANGVFGKTDSSAGNGVYGYASSTSGLANGVAGKSDSTSGTGVFGDATATSGTTYGVYGESDSTSAGIGVYGSGITGVSGTGSTGVYGSGTTKGVYGAGPYGVYGVSTTGGGDGIYAEASGGPNSNYAGYFQGNVQIHGTMSATGTKSAVVDTQDYGTRTLYAVESPEVWFQDFGTGQLTNGKAVISIDPVFAETVNLTDDYHVFFTPLGDCALYVSGKTPTSFTVQALGGQTCSIAFDYNIVAKRLGYENVRLAQPSEGGAK